MLTRPDAGPGCSWMKGLQERLPKPSVPLETPNPRLRLFWRFYLFLMLALVFLPLTRPWSSVTLNSTREYQSQMRIAGMPVIAVGGLSAAILALGGGAVGWWAIGGGAVGRYALGGLAFGDYAYAGNGVAFGYHEASGRQ